MTLVVDWRSRISIVYIHNIRRLKRHLLYSNIPRSMYRILLRIHDTHPTYKANSESRDGAHSVSSLLSSLGNPTVQPTRVADAVKRGWFYSLPTISNYFPLLNMCSPIYKSLVFIRYRLGNGTCLTHKLFFSKYQNQKNKIKISCHSPKMRVFLWPKYYS